MLLASNTPHTPWTIIRSDDKKRARINCIKHILSQVEYPDKIEDSYLITDKNLVLSGEEEIANMEKNLQKAV